MKLLLINKNPIVRKLVKLSAEKAGIGVAEVESFMEVEDFDFDFVFIDDESLEEGALETLSEKIPHAKYGFIHSKDRPRESGFSLFVQKPFLPTDMVDLLKSEAQGGSPKEFFQGSASLAGEDAFSKELEEFSLDLPKKVDVSLEKGEELDFDLDTPLSLDEPLELPKSEEDAPLLEDDLLDSPQELANQEGEDLDLDLDSLDFDEESPAPNSEVPKDAPMEVDMENLSFEETPASKPKEEDPLSDLEWDDSLLEASSDSLEVASSKEALALDSSTQEDLDLDLDSLGFSLEEKDEEPETREENLTLDKPLETGGILDANDLETVKHLLEEDDPTPIPAEDLDMNDIKIESSELASLTEEALSEALGEELTSDEEEEFNFEDDTSPASISSAPLPQEKTESFTSVQKSEAPAAEAIKNLQGLSIPALKELLDGMQLTISISFPDKK
ncbi:hypothetical protein [Wolinella succinogenes]|uniref:hypothetical protein n=1 Tax=Wolinella succinogenes TaxID=844 RepID=UPI002409D057|nr:hypothetical protein [Wolinella succinogenes]